MKRSTDSHGSNLNLADIVGSSLAFAINSLGRSSSHKDLKNLPKDLAITDGNEDNRSSNTFASTHHLSSCDTIVNGTVSAGASPLSSLTSFDCFKKEISNTTDNVKVSSNSKDETQSNHGNFLTQPSQDVNCQNNETTKETDSTNVTFLKDQSGDKRENLKSVPQGHLSHASTSVVSSVSLADTANNDIDILQQQNGSTNKSSNNSSPKIIEEGAGGKDSLLNRQENIPYPLGDSKQRSGYSDPSSLSESNENIARRNGGDNVIKIVSSGSDTGTRYHSSNNSHSVSSDDENNSLSTLGIQDSLIMQNAILFEGIDGKKENTFPIEPTDNKPNNIQNHNSVTILNSNGNGANSTVDGIDQTCNTFGTNFGLSTDSFTANKDDYNISNHTSSNMSSYSVSTSVFNSNSSMTMGANSNSNIYQVSNPFKSSGSGSTPIIHPYHGNALNDSSTSQFLESREQNNLVQLENNKIGNERNSTVDGGLRDTNNSKESSVNYFNTQQNSDILRSEGSKELTQFVVHRDSRALMFFDAEKIPDSLIKSVVESFGAVVYLRFDFKEIYGVVLFAYYDLRSAVKCHMNVMKELERVLSSSQKYSTATFNSSKEYASQVSEYIKNVKVHYTVSLDAANSCQEGCVLLRFTPSHLCESEVHQFLSKYGSISSIVPMNHTFNGGSTEELLRVEYHDSRDSRIALLEYKNTVNSNDNSQDAPLFFPWCGAQKQQYSNMLVEADRSEHEKLQGFRLLTVLRKWRSNMQPTSVNNGSDMQQGQESRQHRNPNVTLNGGGKYGRRPPPHHHKRHGQQSDAHEAFISNQHFMSKESRHRTHSNASSVGSMGSNGKNFSGPHGNNEDNKKVHGINNLNNLVSFMSISDSSNLNSPNSAVDINSISTGGNSNVSQNDNSATTLSSTTDTYTQMLSMKDNFNQMSQTNQTLSHTHLADSNSRGVNATPYGGSGSVSATNGGNSIHHNTRNLYVGGLNGKGIQSLKGMKQNQNNNLYNSANKNSSAYNLDALPLSAGSSPMIPHYMNSRGGSLMNGNNVVGINNQGAANNNINLSNNFSNNNHQLNQSVGVYGPQKSQLSHPYVHNGSGNSSHNFGNRNDRDNNTNNNESGQIDYALDYNRIAMGIDRRTTIMIRNIPNKYSQQLLLNEINANYVGCYDFFYLPIDFKNKCNVGYAFINFMDPLHILDFFKEFNGTRWRNFNSEKVCSLSYARIQGKQAMIARFQNSSLLDKDDEFRPLLFISSGAQKGQPEPFPLPSCSHSNNNHGSGYHYHSHHNSSSHSGVGNNMGMLNNNLVGPHFGANNSNYNSIMGSYQNRSRGGQHIPLHHLHSYQQHQHVVHDKQHNQTQEYHGKNDGEHLQLQEYRTPMQTTYNNRVSSSPNTGGNIHFQNLP